MGSRGERRLAAVGSCRRQGRAVGGVHGTLQIIRAGRTILLVIVLVFIGDYCGRAGAAGAHMSFMRNISALLMRW